MRDTSLDAYDSLLPVLPKQERELMLFMHGHPGESFSRSEIAYLTGLRLSAVCGRVNELVKKGYLSDEGYKHCSVTGKRVHAVVIPGQLSLLEAA